MTPALDRESWLVPEWNAPASVCAVASTRAGPGCSRAPYWRFNLGAGSGDDPAAVAANRAALGATLALPSEPRWLRQVHGRHVVEFGGEPDGAAPEADASVTRSPGVVLAILSADCLPVLLAADDGSELAAIHAGWRGMAAGVIEAAVARLRTPPPRLVAWLGPAIGPDAYEVGDEVRAAMTAGHAHAQTQTGFRAHGAGKWFCDLYALARQRLAMLGVARISGGGRCTLREPGSFYSYRRDGRTGRMATLIWLAGR